APEPGPASRLSPQHTDDEGEEDGHIEEREEGLQVVGDVGVSGRDEGREDSDEHAHHRGDAADPQVIAVRTAGSDVVLPDVVGPYRVEGGDIRRHARHERSEEHTSELQSLAYL